MYGKFSKKLKFRTCWYAHVCVRTKRYEMFVLQKTISTYYMNDPITKSICLIFLSDCNWTRTQNNLVPKGTLNHLANLVKWLSIPLGTKWFWVRLQLQSLKRQISRLLRARSCLKFRQL